MTKALFPADMCPVRIMLFVGGPTTEGGGQVVGKELEQSIRSHKAPSRHSASSQLLPNLSMQIPPTWLDYERSNIVELERREPGGLSVALLSV